MKHESVPKSVVFGLKLYLELLKRMNERGLTNFSAVVNKYLRLGLNHEREMELQTMSQIKTVVNEKAQEVATEIYKDRRNREMEEFQHKQQKAIVVHDEIKTKPDKKKNK